MKHKFRYVLVSEGSIVDIPDSAKHINMGSLGGDTMMFSVAWLEEITDVKESVKETSE